MHHYDMNLNYIDELLWHFQYDADKAYMKKMWPVLKSHLAWEKRNFDPDGDHLYDAYCCIWASDALYYSGGAVTHSSAYNYRGNRLAARIAQLIGEDGDVLDSNRFDMVEKLENMTAQERFDFWRDQLSKCIRCNACRNVCPACTCENCVFDNPNSGISNKAAADSFEENMFHIIRAFHVAGRCTDCGECSRVCPQHIPLHLLNRKFIKDINSLYGEYQAGEDTTSRAPLNDYKQDDCEASVVHERGVE